MKLVSPKDKEMLFISTLIIKSIFFIVALFAESTDIIHLGVFQWQVLFAYNLSFFFFLSLYKHFRAHINFLETYGKWACIHEFSINQKFIVG